MFHKKTVLKIFAIITGKQLCWSIFFNFFKKRLIVRKGVPAPPPFLRPPPLDPACPPPLLKSLFPLPSYRSTHFKGILDSSPNTHATPYCPTFLGLNKYQNGDFTSSTIAFYQKSIFNLLNPFTNRSS